MVPKPPHARKHWANKKRYPHAELEEHNHIGLERSRRSKEAFIQCMASVPAAALGPLISDKNSGRTRGSGVPPRKTFRRAYLFPVPCEFFAAIAVACIAVVRATERKRRHIVFAGETRIKEKDQCCFARTAST